MTKKTCSPRFLSLLPISAAALGCTLLTATSAAAVTAPRQGVLNFEPGTSIEDVQARIENENLQGRQFRDHHVRPGTGPRSNQGTGHIRMRTLICPTKPLTASSGA